MTFLERLWQSVPNLIVDGVPYLRQLRHKVVSWREDLARKAFDRSANSEAIEHTRHALALEPDNVEALTTLGSAFFEDQKFEESAKVFSRVLDLDYFNTDALKGRAYALDTLGHTDEAIYDYLRFLSLKNDDADVHANFVSALLNAGRIEEAIAAGEKAKGQFPDDAMVRALMAQAYYDAGRLTDAEREIEHACALDPNSVTSFQLAGLIYLGVEKPTKAAEVLRRAVSLAPSDAEIYLELGNVMEDLGNFEEYRVNADKAKDLFEASHDIDGAHRAYWGLGWANYKLGRWAESAAASARAVELNPDVAVPRYNLGLALLRQGEVDKATEVYRAALALDDQGRLHQDGILDLIEAMKQVPELPGAAGILSDLQAHAERIRTRRRVRHKTSPAQ